MPKAAKWIGIVLASVAGVFALAVVVVYLLSGRVLGRTYDVAAEGLALPTDSTSLAEGERFATLMGCTDCHAADLGGKNLVDAPVFAVLDAPNLTAGQGGIGATYTVADWEHAIRHGIRPDGSPLLVMPSADYHHFSDEDIARLIAHLRTAPPVDRERSQRRVGPVGRMAIAASPGGLLHAAAIDHAGPHVAAVERGVTVEFGQYYARACTGCHGADWSGGPVPGAQPGDPPAANLTPDSATGIGTWTLADFTRAMRDGRRPDGSAIDQSMPWRAFQHFTDQELEAMWLFFQVLEPIARP